MNKELRIAIQADNKGNFIPALETVIKEIKNGKGSVPIFKSSDKGYRFRFVIIEDATNSTSFDDNNLIERKK